MLIKISAGIIFFLIPISLAIFALWIFSKPKKIAVERKHPDVEAINMCAWVGLFIFPALLVAFVWAYYKK